MTIKVGITGGIGSGKSVVSKILGIMGIPVYDSDTEAKRIMNRDAIVHEKLKKLLGAGVIHNGQVNTKLLSDYLFGNDRHRKEINGIVHPRVKEDFQQWVLRHKQEKTVAIESAILIEAGFEKEVDFIVMVYAPLEKRIGRVIKRDNATKEKILKRIESQMDENEKLKKADYIIYNDDEHCLMSQVLNLVSSLQKI